MWLAIVVELQNITEQFHLFTSANDLGAKLVSAFEKLEKIDRQYPRKEMIAEFMERLDHEMKLETGDRQAMNLFLTEIGARLNDTPPEQNTQTDPEQPYPYNQRDDGRSWTDSLDQKSSKRNI